ncbi:HAD-IIB family hydrolase [Arthrobacter sp. Sr24]
MNAKPLATAHTTRAIFLDVDGTYADFGVVPDGHVKAVQQARAAGHKVFICTGRPLPMLPESILGAGFDGVVASAGAYVQVGDEVLINATFPEDLATRALDVLDTHDAVYILEAQESIQVPAAAEARLRAHIAAHFASAPVDQPTASSSIIGSLTSFTDRSNLNFAKISVFESPVLMADLIAEIGPEIDVVANSIATEGPHAGELFQRGISKADGVAAVIAHFDIPKSASIAFGDGQNDLEMLAFAGIGVAIEGSAPELLTVADRTAPRPSELGIATAFAELGLI